MNKKGKIIELKQISKSYGKDYIGVICETVENPKREFAFDIELHQAKYYTIGKVISLTIK